MDQIKQIMVLKLLCISQMPTVSQGLCYNNDNIPPWEMPYPPSGQVYTRTCYEVQNENCRSRSYTILIKNCTAYFVYYLRPTVGCNSAYCFGSKLRCPTGQSSETGFTPNCNNVYPSVAVTPKVTVGFHIEKEQSSVGGYSIIYQYPKFICNADDATDDYNYDVYFYVNDVMIPNAIYRNVSKNNIQNAILHQKHWENIFRPNMMVKCSIAVRYINRGVPGQKHDSENYFAGIKVLGGIDGGILGFDIKEGETKNIQVQSTMPIGCSYLEGMFSSHKYSCFVALHNGIPGYQLAENCVESVDEGYVEFSAQRCRLNIYHDEWNRIFNITITANADNTVNLIDRIVYLRLFVTSTLETLPPILRIWENIVLPDIKIAIKDTDEAKLGSFCYSRNDPHMRSFDETQFEFQHGVGHGVGQYILYRHSREPQQVNVILRNCVQGGVQASCNCGVAIRSARSSFVVNFCETTDDHGDKKINRYAISRLCDAQNLLIEEPKPDYYKVTFPTGTQVEFNYKDYGSTYGIQSIEIKPSQFDHGLTSGLCGLYNGNKEDDTQLRPGTAATSFEESWKVPMNESMFSTSGELPEFPYKVQEYCTCKVPKNTPQPGQMQPPEFNCRLSDQMKECRDKDAPSSVFRATCISSAHQPKHSSDRSRTIRSTANNDGDDGIPPQYEMLGTTSHDSSILKAPEWRNGLTEAIARDICRTNMLKLSSYSVCSTYVPIVSSDDIIEECVKDMKTAGSDMFLKASLEGYQNACYQTGKKMENLTQTKITSPSGESTSVFELISKSTCPQECSGQGICEKGKCNCNAGFFGPDCSLNAKMPPRLLKEGFNEHCDNTVKACRKIPIPGSDFIAEKLTCEFTRFVVLQNNSQINDSTSAVYPGTYSSSFMMYCKLPEGRVNRSTGVASQIATGYYIRVSNDGSTFTDKLTFIIYDPGCFQCNTSVISCVKLDTCPEQDDVNS